jgi:hypothetical protein
MLRLGAAEQAEPHATLSGSQALDCDRSQIVGGVKRGK